MDNETCKISEEQLERRRTCIMHLSHENVGLGKEVYEFCDLFSHSSEDIADAADFFINNLKGFSKDSKQNQFRVTPHDTEGSAGYFSIICYKNTTDFLCFRILTQERGKIVVIFIGIWKWLKKYKVSDQSSWSLRVSVGLSEQSTRCQGDM